MGLSVFVLNFAQFRCVEAEACRRLDGCEVCSFPVERWQF